MESYRRTATGVFAEGDKVKGKRINIVDAVELDGTEDTYIIENPDRETIMVEITEEAQETKF